jgi:hypothetical protein
MLLPEYDRWLEESQDSDIGDKTICAEKFLNDVLPYLVEVLVTDGIYFTQEFPTHVMSRYLLLKIPNYRTWACSARESVKVIEESRISDEIQALNQASQAAMESCHRRIDQLESILQLILSKVEGISTVDQKMDNVIALLSGRQELVPPPQEQDPAPAAQRQHQNRQQPQQQQVQQEQQEQEEEEDENFPVDNDEDNDDAAMDEGGLPAPQRIQEPRIQEPRIQQQQQQQVNAALYPSNRPFVPAFSGAMPRSFVILVSEWSRLGLSKFILDNSRTHWPKGMKTAYTRRVFMMNFIKNKLQFVRNPDGTAFEGMQQQKLIAAAEIMDNERDRTSMYKYWEHHHTRCASVARRATPIRRRRRSTSARRTRTGG